MSCATHGQRGEHYTGPMKRDEIADLMRDIDRSVQMRKSLLERLGRDEAVDLVAEWLDIEQIDIEVANKIRKRPIE